MNTIRVIGGLATLLPALAAAEHAVPLDTLAAPIGSTEILETWTGAAHDSLVLRVSVGHAGVAAEPGPYLVIEEMVFPRPLRILMSQEPPPPDPDPGDFRRVLRVDLRAVFAAAVSSDLKALFWARTFSATDVRLAAWLSPREFALSARGHDQDVVVLVLRQTDGRYVVRTPDYRLNMRLPIEELSAPLLPRAVERLTTGPPAQSRVLRVVVERYPGRCCSSHAVVIEELAWPPRGVVLMRGSGHDAAREEADRWLAGGRLDDRSLQAVWREAPRQRRQLLGHIMPRYAFLSWLGPHAFAVGNGDVQLVIARTGGGAYAYREILGNLME